MVHANWVCQAFSKNTESIAVPIYLVAHPDFSKWKHCNRLRGLHRNGCRAMARPCGLLSLHSGCLDLAVLAELSSAAAGGSGRALSERIEFSPTPHAASSARNRAAALTAAAFSFGYFFFGQAKKTCAAGFCKSTSPAGARPGLPRALRRKTRQSNLARRETGQRDQR